MQKNNTIVIVLLVIVIAILVYMAFGRKEKVNDVSQVPVGEIQEANYDGWSKSPKFGIYYQSSLNIIEYYRTKDGLPVNELQEGASPEFTATFGVDQDSMISWGGNSDTKKTICNQDEFDPFTYGISRTACIGGFRAIVSRSSARSSVNEEDLKIFGDFVLKNQ